MFKYMLISFSIAPLLIGAASVRARDDKEARTRLRLIWMTYAILWFSTLYYLKSRWS